MVSSYPGRAKAANAERDPRVSVCVLSDEWNGAWVQVDGDAEVLHMPEAEDAWWSTSGASPVSILTGTSTGQRCGCRTSRLIRITPTRWGPIATGGFPEDVAARLDARGDCCTSLTCRSAGAALRPAQMRPLHIGQLACDTVDMLKSGTRSAGMAVRLK